MGGIIGKFLVFFGGLMLFIVGLFMGIDALFLEGENFPFQAMVVISGIALVFFVTGVLVWLRAKSAAAKNQELAMKIFNQGVLTRGKVTFVDKNYSLLVNNKPIYSIVEVAFTDEMGREHVARKENIESDLVIRSQVVIGSEIDMKYLREDPTKTVFLIWDPGKRPENWDGSMPAA